MTKSNAQFVEGLGATKDNAGVIARPPVLYVAALLVATLLHGYRPLLLAGQGFLPWLGAALMLAGVALILKARRTLLDAGTNIDPKLPNTALVTNGPFRASRNPLYVGLTTIFIGIALVANEGWGLIVLVPLMVVVHWHVVLREERYLERKFGAEYRRYRGTVRRYL